MVTEGTCGSAHPYSSHTNAVTCSTGTRKKQRHSRPAGLQEEREEQSLGREQEGTSQEE